MLNALELIAYKEAAMSPCGKIPKSGAQSQLKMCLYESFENHWHTMVWLARGSRDKADIWWDDTIEWLEHVSLEHVSIEKINPFPYPNTNDERAPSHGPNRQTDIDSPTA